MSVMVDEVVEEAVAMARDSKHLGEFVRRTREARGMTQVELSQKSGITQGQISAMETGKAHVFRPSVETVASLAGALAHDPLEEGRLLRAMLLRSGLRPASLGVLLGFLDAMNRGQAVRTA